MLSVKLRVVVLGAFILIVGIPIVVMLRVVAPSVVPSEIISIVKRSSLLGDGITREY
jgi:hypothetical protein